MNRDNQFGGVTLDERLCGLTCNGPHGRSDHPGAGASIGGMEARTPQPGGFYRVPVELGGVIKGRRCIFPEKIHHLRCDSLFILEMNGFDDGFRRGTMPAACIGKEKKDVGLLRNGVLHLFFRVG